MSLPPGTHVGVYQVLGPIGAGGMGEVYRARDAKLQRDVALKCLPDSFLADAGRRARFEREALTLAALNHPHIAQVFGLEEVVSDSRTIPRPVLVMELIEGEDLSDRIARGRLPLRDALKIARQIAAALEAAHAAGIIHRDLKPSNIRVRPDGVVKVLDFGLARSSGGDSESSVITDTITTTGVVVGSAAYMSPEQARGLAVDARTDIWAFGCVLFEMLTGRRAFAGGSRSDTIADVLNAEPDFGALPAATPPSVRRLLRRCLAKSPGDRLHAIADARLELDEPAETDRPGTSTRHRRPALAALALLAAGAVAGGLLWNAWRPQPEMTSPVVRFELDAEDPDRVGRRPGLAISSDGEHIAYATPKGFVLRSRGRLAPRILEGLGTFPGLPFFSPDGAWLAYLDAPVLKKISTSGGAPVPIAEIGWAASGHWTADGILLAGARGLFRVPADGGTVEPIVTELDPGEQVTAPEVLPGGAAVVYTVIPTRAIVTPGMGNVGGARIEAVDLKTRKRTVLLRGGSYARYTTTGHLVYLSAGSLHAVAFDARGLQVVGQAAEAVSGPIFEFAVSGDGTLAYSPATASDANTLVWVDRQGREEPLGAPPQPYIYPRLSPDGTRVALDVLATPDRDIWIWDLRRKTLDRFTVDPAGNPLVAWSANGRHLAFGSDRLGHTTVFMQAADGSGRPEQLLAGDRIQMPLSFAPDGRLLFSEEVQGQGRNIHALALDGSGTVEPLVATTDNELNAEVSSDGKWLAYDSNESGQFEVYVRPYPKVAEGRWKISRQGGRQPLWSPDGRELFYRDFAGAVMAVPVSSVPSFTAGEVVRIVDGGPYAGGGPFGSARTYDVSRDGQRFLMIKRDTLTGDAHRIVVVVNWFEELKRLVPAGTAR